LERKRKEINSIIGDILNRNDDKKESQMKHSLENLKKKVTEILRLFKDEVENKMKRSLKQEES
jgi:hypothetical protein